MKGLVVGIIIVAVVIGIFFFVTRDTPDLAPRVIKPVNSTNSSLMPDLVISNLTYTYVSNGSIIINNTNFTSYSVFVSTGVRNSGNAVAGASTTQIILSQIINGSARISIQSLSTPALGAGQSASVFGVLSGLTGMSLLQADADRGYIIVESNEANNMRVINATLP